MDNHQHTPSRWDSDIPLPERRSNRPVRWYHHVENAVMGGAFALLRAMGVDRASAFAGSIMKFAGRLMPTVNQKAYDHLSLVYPEMNRTRQQEIVRELWDNIGRLVGELPHLSAFSIDGPDPRIEIQGAEHISDWISGERHGIIYAGHFSNWELIGAGLQQMGLKTGIVYRMANNPLIDERITHLRAAVMSRFLIPKGKKGSRQIVDMLKRDISLSIMMDQKLNTGIEVPFLGHTAPTAEASARMAIKFNLPLVFVYMVRLGGARFRMVISPPIDPGCVAGEEDPARALTIRMLKPIEEAVHAHPGQWLWFHRRWSKSYVRETLAARNTD